MMSAAEDVENAEGDNRENRWQRFPSTWIVGTSGTEEFFSKFIWVVIPIQYFVFASFSGGFGSEAYAPTAVFALISIAALFLASCAIAAARFVYTKKLYSHFVRIWAIALIVTWVVTYALLGFSYYISPKLGMSDDLVHEIFCDFYPYDCARTHPNFGFQNFLEYLIYASLSLVLIRVISVVCTYVLRMPVRKPITKEPNVFGVALSVALLMTAMNGASTWPHDARLPKADLPCNPGVDPDCKN
jgi:hypothetical protein